jgi:hypothetical protein
LLLQLNLLAASLTFCTAGSNSPIKIAMIAITTNNSIKVKPFLGKGFVQLCVVIGYHLKIS